MPHKEKNRPIHDFAHPLGLRCTHGFRASDVARFINGEGSCRFKEHIDDHCWICLARILLFTEIGKMLRKKICDPTFTIIRVQEYLKIIWRSSPFDVKIDPLWLAARRKNRYVGEITYVWIEKGKIRLKILEPSKKSQKPSIDTVCAAIEYPAKPSGKSFLPTP
jgi:hypothetical protein